MKGVWASGAPAGLPWFLPSCWRDIRSVRSAHKHTAAFPRGRVRVHCDSRLRVFVLLPLHSGPSEPSHPWRGWSSITEFGANGGLQGESEHVGSVSKTGVPLQPTARLFPPRTCSHFSWLLHELSQCLPRSPLRTMRPETQWDQPAGGECGHGDQ